MLTLGIVLASIAAYFMIGWLLARWDMPHLFDRARSFWEVDRLNTESHVPGEVRGMSVVTLLFLAVIFKHWFAREHRDQQATEEALDRTRQHIGSDHIWDA